MKLATLALFAICTAAALAPLAKDAASIDGQASAFPGWPDRFEGRPLTRLPLSALEQRFQQAFPGKVARFSDGRHEVILRWVSEGSRKLHSAADCFKANGYALTPQPILVQGNQRWSGFIAGKGSQRLLVRERIADGAGGEWSDVSAWYWAVQLGQTRGPWWTVTVAGAAGAGGQP